ncbi:hypothetical protein [Streptomyces sp. NPDC085540]|uniref:hypothetical protein n=1 Tax=Streptomyces sp. NPDC085540 TaxID=3365730 RepID=UPI0037D73176
MPWVCWASMCSMSVNATRRPPARRPRSLKYSIAIADQGWWARPSRSVFGYMLREDGWEDNASVGLT